MILTSIGFLPSIFARPLLSDRTVPRISFCSRNFKRLRQVEKCCVPVERLERDEVILSLDIGTSSIKCAPYFVTHNALGPKEIRSIDTCYTGGNGICVTQNTTEWYHGVISTIRDVVGSCPKAKVVGISVTGQMQDLIAIGEQLPSPLKQKTMLYSDCRSGLEAKRLSQILNTSVQATNLLAKLSFVQTVYRKENESGCENPYAFQLLFGAADFITYALSAHPKVAVTDSTTVSTTGLSVGPRHRDYDYDALLRCGLGKFIQALPKILDGPQVVGQLSRKAAVEIGYPELQGIDIIHAGGDAFTSTVGGGCISGGKQSYIYAGTSGWVGATIPWGNMPRNKNDGVFLLGHAIDESLNILVASVTSVGGSLDSGSKLLLNCNADELDVMAERCNIGADGLVFIPYINGRRCPSPTDCTAGGLYGMRGDTNREHIARALIEGVVFSVVEASQQLISPYDVEPPKVLTGGVSRCHIFGDGMAALCGGGTIYIGDTDVGLLGAGTVAIKTKNLAGGISVKDAHVQHSGREQSMLSVCQEDCEQWRVAFLRWQKVVRNLETLW